MKNDSRQECHCGPGSAEPCCGGPAAEMFPIYHPLEHPGEPSPDAACCGPPPGPPSDPHERPGFSLCPFVDGFWKIAAGEVPRVRTALDWRDRLGTLAARCGVGRANYKIAPGLYAAGTPGAQSAVLVTANYKLSFDHLRKVLGTLNLWILVLDTRGINVWCAAGKGTFGTAELVRRVRQTRLNDLVDHRGLIVPQLGATGVSAQAVKKGCGFAVIWGPIRAFDLPAFLSAGLKARDEMRRVTFSFAERLVLVPVELYLLRKIFAWSLAAIFVLSGIGRPVFSFAAAWQRGVPAVVACLAGIVAGAVVVPILLPWLPGRAFSIKGTCCGALAGLLIAVSLMGLGTALPLSSLAALTLLTTVVSSYLAMNFTGSTPYTSPSGVEREMRRAIPLQLAGVLAAAVLWVIH
jgi:CO dehydrogenase/acetyl-CoA synthase delta subunit